MDLNPFALFAAGLAVWGLWRLVRWAASGGRLPLRDRRGSASGFTAAGLAVQQFYQPNVKHVIEQMEHAEAHREDDEDGAPPESGTARRAHGR